MPEHYVTRDVRCQGTRQAVLLPFGDDAAGGAMLDEAVMITVPATSSRIRLSGPGISGHAGSHGKATKTFPTILQKSLVLHKRRQDVAEQHQDR